METRVRDLLQQKPYIVAGAIGYFAAVFFFYYVLVYWLYSYLTASSNFDITWFAKKDIDFFFSESGLVYVPAFLLIGGFAGFIGGELGQALFKFPLSANKNDLMNIPLLINCRQEAH